MTTEPIQILPSPVSTRGHFASFPSNILPLGTGTGAYDSRTGYGNTVGTNNASNAPSSGPATGTAGPHRSKIMSQ